MDRGRCGTGTGSTKSRRLEACEDDGRRWRGHGPHPARGIVLADVEAFSHLARIGVEGWEGQVPDRARRVLVGWSRSGPRRAAPPASLGSHWAPGARKMPEMEAHRATETRAMASHANVPSLKTRGFRICVQCPVLNPRGDAPCRRCTPSWRRPSRPSTRVGPAEKLSCLPRTPRPVNAPNRPRATLPPRVSHLVRARTPLTRFALGVDPSVKPPGGSDARQCGPVPSVQRQKRGSETKARRIEQNRVEQNRMRLS